MALFKSDEEQLAEILEQGSGPDVSPIAWAESVFGFVLGSNGPRFLLRGSRTSRLALLERMLQHHPKRETLAANLREVFGNERCVRPLAEAGLADQTSFVVEGWSRFINSILPCIDPAEDVYTLLERLDLSDSDADWFEALPPDAVEEWKQYIGATREDMLRAAGLIALRASGTGLSRDFLNLLRMNHAEVSPFGNLPFAVKNSADAILNGRETSEWREALARCRETLDHIENRLDVQGVQTGLVFRMELVRGQLDRIENLFQVILGERDGWELARTIVRGSIEQHSVQLHAKSNLKLLSLKVVEYNAHKGEHYITVDETSWRHMGWAAAGAGVLTAGVAFVKYSVAYYHLPPLIEAIAFSLNYALGFVLIQLFGMTLASKQPAMTASALAHALGGNEGDNRQIVELVAGISRTQFIATVGNVVAALPVAYFIEWAMRDWAGIRLFGYEKCEKTLLTHFPLSWSLVYAALTGVCLWLGSVAAGWGANWMAFRNLPEAVRKSPGLIRWFGRGTSGRVADFVERQFSGIISCLVLGFLLGFFPVLGKFAGVNLDVRHVTFAAAGVGFAWSGLAGLGETMWGPLAWAILGVLLVGLLNFAVSGMLALRLAILARGLRPQARSILLKDLYAAFRQNPRSFFLPRKSESNVPDDPEMQQGPPEAPAS